MPQATSQSGPRCCLKVTRSTPPQMMREKQEPVDFDDRTAGSLGSGKISTQHYSVRFMPLESASPSRVRCCFAGIAGWVHERAEGTRANIIEGRRCAAEVVLYAVGRRRGTVVGRSTFRDCHGRGARSGVHLGGR